MSIPKRKQYDQSQPNWKRLQQYAARVARETKAPREMTTVTAQETRTREERAGLFRRSTRLVPYTVNTSKKQQLDYWKLTSRYWIRSEKNSYGEEIRRDVTNYCLHADGHLFILNESTEEVFPKQGPMIITQDSSRYGMTEAEALVLDFEPKFYSSTGRISVETNRDPDRSKVKYHAKGMGLSLALKALLERR
ncbi:hypothetical protein [Actinomadura latina]|uniref:Uncharacterized protein n=1 Tax=Actinomadura latina TaxID=163603 RepID=A0A846ZBY7_9ACTN|nr:hypothetical protein [Actinomadura latina]NKZ09227.1 hypothetical protein [Actinomadura latina]